MKKIADAITLYGFRSTRANFYRDLAEMYARSEPMVSFLEGEIGIAKRTKQNSRAAALKMILKRLRSGEKAGQLSYLLDGVVPRSDSMMLMSVERAQNKTDALNALALAIEQQAAMKQVMVTSSILPAVMLPVCSLLIKILGDVMLSIDKSTPVFVKDHLWTGSNWLAREISFLARDYGIYSLLGIGLFFSVVVWSLPRWTGPWRLKVDGWPIYGLFRDFQAGMLFSSMALLLKTGTPLKAAVEDLAQRAAPWMRWQLRRVLQSLEEQPTAVIEAFSRGVLSPVLLGRAATLARSAPTFSDVLVTLGTQEGGKVLARVKKAALVANLGVVGILAVIATFMGISSITVPGKFASLMEPTAMMQMKQEYEAKQKPGYPAS